MEKIEKDFDNVNKHITRLSSDFNKDILKKKKEFDSLVKNIQRKGEVSILADSKLKSLELNISVLDKQISSLNEDIISRKKSRDSMSDKTTEITELERKREVVLSETKKISMERDSIILSVNNISKELRELQNYIDKLGHQRVALMDEMESINKQISIKDDILGEKERRILPLNNEISKKQNFILELNSSYIQKEKKFDVLMISTKNLEKRSIDLEFDIKTANEKLKEDLSKLEIVKMEFGLEKNQLKHQEDRLISIKKDILQTILNNKSHIESKKIADLIKSVEDVKKS